MPRGRGSLFSIVGLTALKAFFWRASQPQLFTLSRHIGEEAQSSEGSETKAGRLEYLVKGTILNESCTRVMIKSSEIKSDLDNSNKITDEKKA